MLHKVIVSIKYGIVKLLRIPKLQKKVTESIDSIVIASLLVKGFRTKVTEGHIQSSRGPRVGPFTEAEMRGDRKEMEKLARQAIGNWSAEKFESCKSMIQRFIMADNGQ